MHKKNPELLKNKLSKTLQAEIWFQNLKAHAFKLGLSQKEWETEIELETPSLWKKHLQTQNETNDAYTIEFYFYQKKLYSNLVFAHNWKGFQEEFYLNLINNSDLNLNPDFTLYQKVTANLKNAEAKCYRAFDNTSQGENPFYKREASVNEMVHKLLKSHKKVMVLDIFKWMKEIQRGFSEIAFKQKSERVYEEIDKTEVLIIDNFIVSKLAIWFFNADFFILISKLIKREMIIILLTPLALVQMKTYLNNKIYPKIAEANIFKDFFFLFEKENKL